MCLDSHQELTAAWRAINACPPERRMAALARMESFAAVDYQAVNGRIRRTLAAKNKVEEVRLSTELGGAFRRHYEEAEAMARGAQPAQVGR
jgi:hypothetical protein